MAGKSPVTASEEQKAALETLAASKDRGEADRARAGSVAGVVGYCWSCVVSTGASTPESFGLNTRRLRNLQFSHHIRDATETAAMMFWAFVASGQMRKVDGWKTLAVQPADLPNDLAA